MKDNVRVFPAEAHFAYGKSCDVCGKLFNPALPFFKATWIEYSYYRAKIVHAGKCETMALLQVIGNE